ncbi:hypothetical protein Ciccas_008033, partial [Cichlidogyrus casuarinus]
VLVRANQPKGIHIVHKLMQPAQSDESARRNPCHAHPCSHLCIPSGLAFLTQVYPMEKDNQLEYSCACPDGLVLGLDHKTCLAGEVPDVWNRKERPAHVKHTITFVIASLSMALFLGICIALLLARRHQLHCTKACVCGTYVNDRRTRTANGAIAAKSLSLLNHSKLNSTVAYTAYWGDANAGKKPLSGRLVSLQPPFRSAFTMQNLQLTELQAGNKPCNMNNRTQSLQDLSPTSTRTRPDTSWLSVTRLNARKKSVETFSKNARGRAPHVQAIKLINCVNCVPLVSAAEVISVSHTNTTLKGSGTSLDNQEEEDKLDQEALSTPLPV